MCVEGLEIISLSVVFWIVSYLTILSSRFSKSIDK